MFYRIFFALLLLTQLPVAAARAPSDAEIQQLKNIATSAEPAPAGTPGADSNEAQRNYLNSFMQQLLAAGVSLDALVRTILANAADLQDTGLANTDAASVAGFLQGLASPAELAVAMMAAGYPAGEAVSAVAEATDTPAEALIANFAGGGQYGRCRPGGRRQRARDGAPIQQRGARAPASGPGQPVLISPRDWALFSLKFLREVLAVCLSTANRPE